MATETATKTRKKRRNYSKDFERLTFYLETIIRVKDDPEQTPTEYVKGQIKAYRDVQDYMAGKP